MTIPVSIFAKVLTDTDQTKLESTFSLSVSTYLFYVFIWPAIPILRQQRDWVGGVRKMAIVAELLQEGIFFLIHLFARDVLVMKKLENEKTKPQQLA